ncbi:MAG TPA: hypothetical protein VLI69_03535 [Gammaproteobacteria bacterium]|nr:hypothetical protein [Gammaproteobacteria bacterium]
MLSRKPLNDLQNALSDLQELKELKEFDSVLSSGFIKTFTQRSDIETLDVEVKKIVASEDFPVVFPCRKRIASLKENLLLEARRIAEENKIFLDKLDRDIVLAEEKIKKLKEENQKLNYLLDQQEMLLTQAVHISVNDFKAYEKNAAEIVKNQEAVEAQRKKTNEAKQAAESSLFFARIFLNDDKHYCGTRYAECKKKYVEQVYTSFEKTVKTTSHSLEKKYTDKKTAFDLKFEEAKRLYEANEAAHYAEFPARQQEMAESKKLQDTVLPLFKKLDEASKLYDEIRQLIDSLHAVFEEMKHVSSVEKAEQMRLKWEKISRQLNENRSKVAIILRDKEFSFVADDIKKSKNFGELKRKLGVLSENFSQNGMKAGPLEIKLAKDIPAFCQDLKNNAKEDENKRISKMLTILKTAFADIEYWQKQVSCAARFMFFFTTAMPVGIGQMRTEFKNTGDEATLAMNICLIAEERLFEKTSSGEKTERSVYGRSDPTTEIYSALYKFLENGKLVVTDEKIQYLLDVLEFDMFRPLKGLKALYASPQLATASPTVLF